jgi:hypothetical protein
MKNLAGKKFILQKSEFTLQMNEVHSRHFQHSCPFQTRAKKSPAQIEKKQHLNFHPDSQNFNQHFNKESH